MIYMNSSHGIYVGSLQKLYIGLHQRMRCKWKHMFVVVVEVSGVDPKISEKWKSLWHGFFIACTRDVYIPRQNAY